MCNLQPLAWIDFFDDLYRNKKKNEQLFPHISGKNRLSCENTTYTGISKKRNKLLFSIITSESVRLGLCVNVRFSVCACVHRKVAVYVCMFRWLPSQAQAHHHSGEEALTIFHILPHGHLIWPMVRLRIIINDMTKSRRETREIESSNGEPVNDKVRRRNGKYVRLKWEIEFGKRAIRLKWQRVTRTQTHTQRETV